jgi:hypothetical protein
MFFPHFDLNHKIPSVLTFKTMRRAVGILGISLPVVILIWSFTFSSCQTLLDSISAYYHTDIRDIFVGIICAVSFFFFSYNGYDILDFITFKAAALTSLCVALFPCLIPAGKYICDDQTTGQSLFTSIVHFTCAAVFFSLLAFISIVLFTKSHPGTKKSDYPEKKRTRNSIYVVCGIIIIICISLIAIISTFNILHIFTFINVINPVYWLETTALVSFGISWLVKGEIGFTDKKK